MSSSGSTSRPVRGAFAGLVFSALALASPLGCNETNVCGQSKDQILRVDGGEYRCTQPEDCPRSSDVFVCETSASVENTCVSCVDTKCVRNVPIPCDGPSAR